MTPTDCPARVAQTSCPLAWFSVLSALFLLLVPVKASAEEWVTFTKERVAENCVDPCQRDLVIFVHGILGSKETWLNTDTNAYWPALMAEDPDLAHVDIYRADYESYILRSGPSMEDVFNSFARGMEALHSRPYRTVQFVTHSLGGNVVRRYLLHIKARYGHKALSRYRLVIMLGTPVEGSYFATVADIASKNQLLRVLQPINRNDFLQMLNASIDDLSKKHHQAYCPSLRFFVGYEEESTVLGRIVSPKSAAAGIGCSVGFESGRMCTRGFHRNHISLVKPRNRDDEVYLWVKKLILDCGNGVSEVCNRVPIHPDCGNLEPYTRGSNEGR